MQNTGNKAPGRAPDNMNRPANAGGRVPPRRKRKRSDNKTKIVMACVLVLCMAGSFALGWFLGVDSMTYKGDILLVNDSHRLEKDYVPEGLVNLYEQRHSFRLANSNIYMAYECYEAMEKMFAAAEDDNVNGFIITSGYRDFDRQAEIYAETEAGKAQQPGASEHQTGLAFDVTAENNGGFETTKQYKWLCENAHKFGFIQRYPPNKAHETGISYEPWHYRYVGVDAAKKMRRTGQTLEAFLGAL